MASRLIYRKTYGLGAGAVDESRSGSIGRDNSIGNTFPVATVKGLSGSIGIATSTSTATAVSV